MPKNVKRTNTTKTRVSQSAVAKAEAAEINALAKKLGVDKTLAETQRRGFVSATHVSDQFIELAAQAHDDFGTSLGVKGFTADGARVAIATNAVQGTVLGAANALVKGIEERRLATYGGAAVGAFNVYAQLKVLSRGADADPTAKAHLKKMREELKRYRMEAIAAKKAERELNAQKRAMAKAAKLAAKTARANARKPSASGGSAPSTPTK